MTQMHMDAMSVKPFQIEDVPSRRLSILEDREFVGRFKLMLKAIHYELSTLVAANAYILYIMR